MRKYKEYKICIICEGFEELEYLNAVINKAVFSSKYDFVLINSKSVNNIVDIYMARYQSNSYDVVLVFCDTDKSPYLKYNNIKQSINKFHNSEVADDIVIFGNPCTMQIILSHFSDIKLSSQSKSVNAKYIEKYVNIFNYKATESQRKELFSKIKRDNYEVMKENISKISTDINNVPSTNILKFLMRFENDDVSWINKLNDKL